MFIRSSFWKRRVLTRIHIFLDQLRLLRCILNSFLGNLELEPTSSSLHCFLIARIRCFICSSSKLVRHKIIWDPWFSWSSFRSRVVYIQVRFWWKARKLDSLQRISLMIWLILRRRAIWIYIEFGRSLSSISFLFTLSYISLTWTLIGGWDWTLLNQKSSFLRHSISVLCI